MHRGVSNFLGFADPNAAPEPGSKPDLRVLTEDGTVLFIRWTPNGAECDYRGIVSAETTRRIQAAMRRQWLLGVDGHTAAMENIAEEQRRHQRRHRQDTRYTRIGPPMGHWTDSLGVIVARWAACCRLCGESWACGDRIAWHRVKGPFHLECAKQARDRRLAEPAASKFRKVDAPLPPWPPRGEPPHITDRWRLIRARRASECAVCKAVVAAHEPILWSPEDQLARHYACGVFLREANSFEAKSTAASEDGSTTSPQPEISADDTTCEASTEPEPERVPGSRP